MTFPNQLTILRILLTPVFVATLFVESLNYRILAFGIFFVASLTDWYDGYFARKLGSVSAWGKFLDPLADKVLVLSTFIAFWVIGQVELWMVIIIAARDVVITALRIYAVRSQKPVVTSSFAKWKTASQMASIYFILLYLIIKHKMMLAAESSNWFQRLESFHVVDKLMYFVTIITATSGVHYLMENRQHFKGMLSSMWRFLLSVITLFLSI